MRRFLITASITLGAAAVTLVSTAPASLASEALPSSVAQQLDKQPIEFTMTAAKERRLMMMDSINRQQRYGRGHGYGRGYGAGPRYGYGRRYGYERGYGPPRDYYYD